MRMCRMMRTHMGAWIYAHYSQTPHNALHFASVFLSAFEKYLHSFMYFGIGKTEAQKNISPSKNDSPFRL